MKLRIPVLANLDPEEFGGGSITGGSNSENIIYEKYSNGTTYGTQRPPILAITDASLSVSDTRGRGCYFWETNSTLYFINNATVYRGDYSTTVGTITAGKEPVTMVELDDKVIIIDHENNEGWTITTGHTLAQITDVDFPTDLVQGAAILDGFLFVASSDGTISQSALNDATTWAALDFLTAEREPDKAVHITKHLDHVVVFGSRTIEFFYNAGYPTGSVLQRRNDTSYKTGVTDGRLVHNTGDKVYFLGSAQTGSGSIYVLDSFRIKKVSTPQIDKFIHDTFIQSNLDGIAAGFNINGHELLLLTTLSTVESDFVPTQTIVFDMTSNLWSTWKTGILGLDTFPLVKWTDQTSLGSREGFGIFVNGDVFKFSGTDDAIDVVSVDVSLYVDDNYVEQQEDYILTFGASSSSVNIGCTIVLPEFDGDVKNNKIMTKLELVGDKVSGSLGVTAVNIRWSDDHYNTFTPIRTLDISSRRKMTRLGLFNRRAFELSYTGSEKLRFESFELDFKVSDYA